MTTRKTKPVKRRFSEEEKLCLQHALDHLLANKIDVNEDGYGGWYKGDKSQFIEFHVKAIAILREMLR